MMGVSDITERIKPAGQRQDNGELSQEIEQLNQEWRAKRDNYRNSLRKDSTAKATDATPSTESVPPGDNGLAEAAASGRVQDCQRILQYTGPNVWAKDGTTPLCAAALWGQPDTLRLLLEADANPGLANRSGLQPTALHAAALQENGKIIMMLLDARADPYVKDGAGVTPTDYASCSEAVWPHFAGVGCSRTPKEELISKGVIRKASSALELELEDNNSSQGGYGNNGQRNAGLLKEFSRPGSAYVVTAHHPPRPGSAAVPAYARSNSLTTGQRPGSRRTSTRVIDILAEGDESNEVAGGQNTMTPLTSTASGYSTTSVSLRSLGL